MRLLIVGGTGFIGRHLTTTLLNQGADITLLGRNITKIQHYFPSHIAAYDWGSLARLDPNNFDAIVNLAGENIGNKRWSTATKQMIKDSRIEATETICRWCNQITRRISLYNASAIGIYGLKSATRSTQPFTEETAIDWGHPTDFLSEVGQAWEQATTVNKNPLLHIVYLRFAPVLHPSEGVLKKMLPAFKWGLGGPMGDGKQPLSWVHLHDVIRSMQFLLKNPDILGPVNICSPHWLPQAEFAKILGKFLHRPTIIATPAWLLKLAFGQMAEELLLSGQAVYPKKLLHHQFKFLYPHLEEALKSDL